MLDALAKILSLLTGGAGDKIGNAVARSAEIVALLGIGGAAVTWLRANGDEVFHAITYGELAFWGAIIAAILYMVARLVRIPQ